MDWIRPFWYSCLMIGTSGTDNFSGSKPSSSDFIRGVDCCNIMTGHMVSCTLEIFGQFKEYIFAGVIKCPLIETVHCVHGVIRTGNKDLLAFYSRTCALWNQTTNGEYRIQVNGIPFSAFVVHDIQDRTGPYLLGIAALLSCLMIYYGFHYITEGDYQLLTEPAEDDFIGYNREVTVFLKKEFSDPNESEPESESQLDSGVLELDIQLDHTHFQDTGDTCRINVGNAVPPEIYTAQNPEKGWSMGTSQNNGNEQDGDGRITKL